MMINNYDYLQIVNGNIEISDGTTIRAKRIFEDLVQNGRNLLISRGDGCSKKGQYVIKYQSNNYLFRLFTWPISLFFVLCRMNARTVYISSDFIGAIVVIFLKPLKKWDIVFEAHGILSDESVELGKCFVEIWISFVIEKIVISNVDLVIALSDKIRNKYIEYISNIILAPVYIDTELTNIIESQPKKRLVGLIGPFSGPFNRAQVDFLRENINYIDNRISFKLIGSCNEIINSDRIVYTGYIRKMNDFYREIKECEIIIIPVEKKTSGPLNKILESMALKNIVIATIVAADGIEGLLNNENIIICDIKEMVEKINEVSNNRNYDTIRSRAQIFVNNNYSKKVILDRIISSIEKLHE